MKFSLYSKKNVLDEMQEQTLRKIGERGFCLMWGGLLAAMVIQLLTGNADKRSENGSFLWPDVFTPLQSASGMACGIAIFLPVWEPNAVCSLLAAVAVTVLCGLAYGLLDGRCVYWCFDRSALLCTAPILCISGEEEPEKAGR